MLKRNKIVMLILMLMAAAILTSCASASIASQKRSATGESEKRDKVIQLKLAHFFPTTH